MFWAFSLLEDVKLVFVFLDLASSDSLCGFFRSHTIRSLEAIPIVLPFVFYTFSLSTNTVNSSLMLLISENNLSNYMSLIFTSVCFYRCMFVLGRTVMSQFTDL
ncbi:hypothetical protein Bca4012_045236 [Brassica carinata]